MPHLIRSRLPSAIQFVITVVCALLMAGLLAQPAQANCISQACVSAGPRLTSIDSARGALLNAVTNSLTGGNINLTALDWNALANGNIKLGSLLQALQTQLGVSSPSTALSANATVAQILSAAATAAQADGQTALASALGQAIPQVGPLAGNIRLGDLLDIDLPDNALATTSLNALELLSGSAQLYNMRNVLTTPTPITVSGNSLGLSGLSVGNVAVYVQAVEPPVYVCGPAGTQFHTAAVRIKLNIDLLGLSPDTSSLLGLGGLTGIALQLGQLQLYLEVARAEGTIGLVNALANAVSVQATPGVVDLYLGTMADNVFFNRNHVLNPNVDLGFASIANLSITLPLLGTQTVAVQARAAAKGQNPGVRTLSFPGPFPQTRTASTTLGFVNTLLTDLLASLQLQILPTLGSVVDTALLTPLTGLLTSTLSPILNGVLTGVVDPLLNSLGERLGEVDVTVSGAARLCDLAGYAYNDANHNASRDGDEVGCGQPLYAKLLSATAPNGPAVAVVPIHAGSGAYAFGQVLVGVYQVVLNGSSNAADVNPAAPTGWVVTESPGLSRQARLSTDLAPVNFGLFNGSSISGLVFQDSGLLGATANDGIQQPTEPPLAAATVRALSASNGTVLDATATAANGSFTLWVPASASGSSVRIVETNPGHFVSIAGQVGTTVSVGGSYDRTLDAVTFNHSSGAVHTGLLFADVPENRFNDEGQQTILAGATAAYGHHFTAGTVGQLSLSTTGNPGLPWAVTLLNDVNCNGLIDAGDTPWTNPVNVQANQTLCILAKTASPSNATSGAQHTATLTATFTYAIAGFATAQSRADLTLIGGGSEAGLKLTKTVDKSQAKTGDVLIYTIRFENQSTQALSNLRVNDATPAYTAFTSASCGTPMATGITACVVDQQPTAGTTGPIQWSLTGTLQPGGAGTLGFSVILQ